MVLGCFSAFISKTAYVTDLDWINHFFHSSWKRKPHNSPVQIMDGDYKVLVSSKLAKMAKGSNAIFAALQFINFGGGQR